MVLSYWCRGATSAHGCRPFRAQLSASRAKVKDGSDPRAPGPRQLLAPQCVLLYPDGLAACPTDPYIQSRHPALVPPSMTRSRPVTEKDTSEARALTRANQISACAHSGACIQSRPDRFLLAEHLGLDKSQRCAWAVRRENGPPHWGRHARLWLEMIDDDAFETDLARLVYELRPSPEASPQSGASCPAPSGAHPLAPQRHPPAAVSHPRQHLPERTGPRAGAAVCCGRWGWTHPAGRGSVEPPGATWAP
jgi:hypothetical protein